MVLQRLARSRSAWASLLGSRTSARQFHASIPTSLHEVPNLIYKEEFEEKGIAGLLQPENYDIAYNQNMAFLVDRLNKATKGTDHENSTTKQLVLSLARNPTMASVFAAASMAHNTHFFFDSLSPSLDSNKLENYPTLQEALIKSFGSIDTLWRTMLTTANAMTGPGFVWLVQAKQRSTSAAGNTSSLPEYRILTTYNAGTPYPEAIYRQQGVDQNTALGYNGSAGSFGSTSARGRETPKLPPGTELITPALCVSTWEHCYLPQYGVDGKAKYLIEWWKSINWGAVDNRVEKRQILGDSNGFDKGPRV
ncbi:manganese and iron superoxide dismutase [Aureobasidium sp. EXF-3400]|nr:manganese and iron superoxide dismutase [Aureobasidium sp. EXF-12344]KAI4776299.1 manganese and iron superoxide dismutase [Aureobasidium sp. EXF-3400]